MEETFVCFEMDAALFLLSLPGIIHIYPGRRLEEGRLPKEWGGSPFFDIAALFGDTVPEERAYTVLIRRKDSSGGILADAVKGVCSVPQAELRQIPGALLGEKNRFLKSTVYLAELRRWAFVVDTELLFEMADRMEGRKDEGKQGEAQNSSGECR